MNVFYRVENNGKPIEVFNFPDKFIRENPIRDFVLNANHCAYYVSQELLDPGPQDSPKALSASTEELIDAQLVSSQKDTYVLEVGYKNTHLFLFLSCCRQRNLRIMLSYL